MIFIGGASRRGASKGSGPHEGTLEQALERERDLRQERIETSKYHVAHDGAVRHPDGCNDCRRIAEQGRAAEVALGKAIGRLR